MRFRFAVALALGPVVVVAGCGGRSGTQAGQTSATTTTAPTTSVFAPASTIPSKPSASIAGLVPPSREELAEGRRLFQASARTAGCAFCHALRAAAETSPLGPPLNAEMSEPDTRKFTDAQLAQNVHEWIQDAFCLSPTDATRCMPKNILVGGKAELVSVFVAVCGRTPRTPGCEPVAGSLGGEVGEGMKLFLNQGCAACHFSVGGARSAGPLLYGLAGSKVQLADGKTVTADDAYLTRSLASPDAQIVAGYQSGLMSSYFKPHSLTSAQIRALVAYIKTLRRQAASITTLKR